MASENRKMSTSANNKMSSEAVITLDMMQSFMQSIIKKIDDLDSSLKKIDEFDNSLKKIDENQNSFKERQESLRQSLMEKIERSQDITTMRMEEMQANLRE